MIHSQANLDAIFCPKIVRSTYEVVTNNELQNMIFVEYLLYNKILSLSCDNPFQLNFL